MTSTLPTHGIGYRRKKADRHPSGKQTTTHGFRRPQRVGVLSDAVPTTKPRRKSKLLHSATVIAWMIMLWLSASMYTAVRAGRTARSYALTGTRKKPYAQLRPQPSFSL